MNNNFNGMVPNGYGMMPNPNMFPNMPNPINEMAGRLEKMRLDARQETMMSSPPPNSTKPFVYGMSITDLGELKAQRCIDEVPYAGFMLNKGAIYVKYPSGDIEHYTLKETIKPELPQNPDEQVNALNKKIDKLEVLLFQLLDKEEKADDTGSSKSTKHVEPDDGKHDGEHTESNE